MVLITYYSLKAQKVNLKIKTINFQVFTRTKTLSSFTSDASSIFDAAKWLLINEINNNSNLKLRLIGVRVSALREKKKFNAFENFFTNNFEQDDDCEYKNDLFIKCPICEDLFEGNQDYVQQHIEFCMFK